MNFCFKMENNPQNFSEFNNQNTTDTIINPDTNNINSVNTIKAMPDEAINAKEEKTEVFEDPQLFFNNDISSDQLLKFDMVKCPAYYHSYNIETLEMMERIWGIEAVISYCKLSAFKYRMRLGLKAGNNSLEKDMKKEQWYLHKAIELENKMKQQSK